ncbi:MAG: biopolymer transporter ExbD [Lentisphaerae bacterium]|nr:biopolymer transporter ExbD [Lentisphaerota bacterium]
MKRKLEDPTLDMTPMIDVVFQLIIFFVVTVTMSKELNRDIKLEQGPHGPEIGSEQDSRTFEIEVDKRGWISTRNVQLTKGRLEEILQSRYNKYGSFPVLIRGDFRTEHRDIRAVMDICTKVGLWKVSFVAIKVKATS